MSLETLVKVTLVVELKESATALPDRRDIINRARDVLVDVTKHDDVIDWRVTEVLER